MAIEPEGYLHRARFVAPMNEEGPEVIEEGAVLTRHGRIAAVGPAADFLDPGVPVVEHGEAVLVPPLCNCHTHLELSHLAPFAEDGPWRRPGEMAAWISALIEARAASEVDEEERLFVARQALAGLYSRGCIAVADIGNEPASEEIGKHFKVLVGFFREILGMTVPLAPEARKIAAGAGPEDSLTAHSLYGTAPDIIRALKEKAGEALFPIHLAESLEEVEFVASGTGPLAEFLKSLGGIDPAFVPAAMSPTAFLDYLGALDENTLCVHCVHLDRDDIELLKKRRARVCLCPASNRHIGVGTPPVKKLLDAGIRPGLGTDSLASNVSLDIWHEMKTLARMAPGIEPADIFRMASSWGADILGIGADIGHLAEGYPASFLAVRGKAFPVAPNAVFSFLVHGGSDLDMEWVE